MRNLCEQWQCECLELNIAVVPVPFEWSRLLLQLERVAIQRRKPPFNTRVAKED